MPKPSPVAKPAPNSRPPAVPSPPLWVWLATGVGTLVGFVLLLGLTLWSEQQINHQFTQKAENLLRREWASRSDSVMRVIVLGTSLVDYGVADTKFFTRHCGKRVRVVKLYRNAVNIDGFTTDSPVFQLLERYPPDVLCVEENLLLFRLVNFLMKPGLNSRLPASIHEHMRLQVDAFKIRIGWLAARQEQPQFRYFVPDRHRSNQKDTINLSATVAEIRSREVRTENEVPILQESLQRLHRQGVRLVLLHIPRPAALEAVIHGETRAPLLRRLIDQYKQRYQMAYWQFNQPMPFRYFVDHAHLNYLGSPVYSAWLADQICPIRPRTTR